MFMVAIGMSVGASQTIGKQIGKQDVKTAQEYYRASLQVTFCIDIVIVLTIFFFGHKLFPLLTNNETLIKNCIGILPLFVCQIFPDLFVGYAQGVVRALAIQTKAAVINFIGYWLL